LEYISAAARRRGTKNPLSPGYSVEACDDHFQTMEAWRAFLPTITPNINEMKRRAKTYRAAKEAHAAVEEDGYPVPRHKPLGAPGERIFREGHAVLGMMMPDPSPGK
jgi:hypothetical protein